MPRSLTIIRAKEKLRTTARRYRQAVSDKQKRSEAITTALCKLPEYVDAKTVMFYIWVKPMTIVVNRASDFALLVG